MNSKEEAISKLDELMESMKSLVGCTYNDPQHIRWHRKVWLFLTKTFGQKSFAFLSFSKIIWQFQGHQIVTFNDLNDPALGLKKYNQHAYQESLNVALGILISARDELEDANNLSEVFYGKNTKPEASEIMTIFNLAENKLRKVVRNTPEKESEIQESFENLLIGANITFTREGPLIPYSSKNYRPDFTVPTADLVIEIKFCTKPSHEKEKIAEINDDIIVYSTAWGNLLFVVYDVGTIRDVEKFKNSIESNDNVIVKIVKH